MESHLARQRRSRGKLHRFVKSMVGNLTNLVAQRGPYEEHAEYLHYGILDLLYQLSFRLRRRARQQCFLDYVKVIRMVLERSSIPILHWKATDLWNRILLLGEKDDTCYGNEADREAIAYWSREHLDAVESKKNSKLYSVSVAN